MKKLVIICIAIIVIPLCVYLLTDHDAPQNGFIVDNNTKEWISPDGVHYWYWKIYGNYVLAPRYDCEGNLVREIYEQEPDWDLINTKP